MGDISGELSACVCVLVKFLPDYPEKKKIRFVFKKNQCRVFFKRCLSNVSKRGNISSKFSGFNFDFLNTDIILGPIFLINHLINQELFYEVFMESDFHNIEKWMIEWKLFFLGGGEILKDDTTLNSNHIF